VCSAKQSKEGSLVHIAQLARSRTVWITAALVVLLVAVVTIIALWHKPSLQNRAEKLMHEADTKQIGEVTVTPAGLEILYPRADTWSTKSDHGAKTDSQLQAANLPKEIDAFHLDQFEEQMEKFDCDSGDKQGKVATTNTGSLVATATCDVDGQVQTLFSTVDGKQVPALGQLDAAAIDEALATFARAQDPTVYHVMLNPNPGKPLEGPLILTSSRLTDGVAECDFDTTLSGETIGTLTMTRCEDRDQHSIDYDDFELSELTGSKIVANIDQALADRDAEPAEIHHVSFYIDDGELWAHVSFTDPETDAWIEKAG
jgi:hypothetical protein